MKRKGFVVLAVAAVLALGTATMSAWAAEGWAQSGNTWVYYDSNGYKVTNVWKKPAAPSISGITSEAAEKRLWITGPRLIINGIILILTVRCRLAGFWTTCITAVRTEP